MHFNDNYRFILHQQDKSFIEIQANKGSTLLEKIKIRELHQEAATKSGQALHVANMFMFFYSVQKTTNSFVERFIIQGWVFSLSHQYGHFKTFVLLFNRIQPYS